MRLLLRASLFARGRHLVSSTRTLEGNFSFRRCKSTNRSEYREPLAQIRFYGTDKKSDLSLENDRIRLYDGILHKKVRLVKMFSLVTSLSSVAVQPAIIAKALEKGNLIGAGSVVFVLGIFAFVTPLLLHLITKRYVAYVDYNSTKDTYVATTYNIFARKKETEFTPEDVNLPNLSEMMTTCFIKGKPMFIDVNAFSDIDHFKRIMGFDKPYDFTLDPEDVSSSSKK